MINHRQRSKPATHHRPNEQVTIGLCQVWSWDITYLRSPVKGMFFYLYMIIDVWSRKIMSATVFEEESMDLSAKLFVRTCFTHDVFVCCYNTRHLHSTIRFVAPDDRHYGREHEILANRRTVYEQARRRHPNRWSRHTRNWNPVALVWLNPEKDHAAQQSRFKEAA